MDTLINAAVVLAMIALTAYVIHLLNSRHRHRHLRAVHYDHGLAGFGGPGAGTGRVVPPAETVQPTQPLRKGEPGTEAAERPDE